MVPNLFKCKFFYLIFGLFVISGCSHKIQINADLADLRKNQVTAKSDKNVAYYISEQNKALQVTTPGGGGDEVTYQPYAESEGSIRTILKQKFAKVYSIDDLENQTFIQEKDISFIFTPNIVTNSFSDSVLTWPPTNFEISLTCTAINSKGETIWEKTVKKEGTATFQEFKSDLSLAARRASNMVFVEMLHEIDNAPLFK